ncbi:hypothetical protein H112_01578 [Trichophyton rubrum D6]|uniref:Uncharacterized protein n=2 Tax=Trichophyton rubrum TaxID=5551 RepID=A0A080WX71_TRIRC|nr:uncharacterized protein TERG_12530 [Trichophyton rubrum CBS 118892]EZF26374.1 hypothetical protein H100_01574 [Trichophyton rubrum MR850]EZF45407.1 hypothetical protein H102_01570 [Trichophyton rubrum CBS 100081]EZF55956.1 hypothetical protein H103_01583 [Trichophyton rubrum CBS 288.86]EZF66655.1 hypothetical protein H104_01558 [Trichophyton rubrum CBS 289.86]EZF87953.1 hypothetical protein H110_01577 [Trichophyton rubrum MR1448]EZF98736.1 hypothetical protein H113_01581 [Trichophyton rubr
MAKGNGTTLRVNLFKWKTKLLSAPESLGGKRLVDFIDVDVFLGNTSLLQCSRDGLPRSLAHEKRLNTDNAGSNVLADDLLSKLLSGRTLHKEDSGSTIRDLRGVSSMDGAIGGEGRSDLGEGIRGDARSDTIITVDCDGLLFLSLGVNKLDSERGNLLVEKAGFLSLDSLLVGGGSEDILILAGDLEVLGHVFG